MNFKKWIFGSVDKLRAVEMANEIESDPFLCLICMSRGYDDPMILQEFLSDEIMFDDPYSLVDMDKAVSRINLAIEKCEHIVVLGDYDCDGITATAMLYKFLSSISANVSYIIPCRETDGYGMNVNLINKASQRGVTLIITVDNGISAFDEVDYANSIGIDVVITDHHLPPIELPHAVAVVDPYRHDDTSAFKKLAGVGVAFKLICALQKRMPEEVLDMYSELLAIGTIADMMPLRGENRSIVKAGIEKIRRSPSPGIKALLDAAGINQENINSGNISFGIAPRINAVGRIDAADRAVELLCEVEYDIAAKIAQQLCEFNSKRQEIEREIIAKTCEIIEQQHLDDDPVLVVCGENLHIGVIGIVAAKLLERYGKPTVVLSKENDTVHGSGRSVSGFSLCDAFSSCSNILQKFGGHELAAGVTLDSENVSEFRERMIEYALRQPAIVLQLKIDCKINPKSINMDLINALSVLEPYGSNNHKPIFALCDCMIESITAICLNKHIRISLSKNDYIFEAMLFNNPVETFAFSVGDKVDAAVTLDENEYKGLVKPSIIIKDLHCAGVNQEQMISSLDSYRRFCSMKMNFERVEDVLPSREELAMIYRSIGDKNLLVDKLIWLLSDRVSAGKILISIDVFKEFSLVISTSISGCAFIRRTDFTGKVDLLDSKILNDLQKILKMGEI